MVYRRLIGHKGVGGLLWTVCLFVSGPQLTIMAVMGEIWWLFSGAKVECVLHYSSQSNSDNL